MNQALGLVQPVDIPDSTNLPYLVFLQDFSLNSLTQLLPNLPWFSNSPFIISFM